MLRWISLSLAGLFALGLLFVASEIVYADGPAQGVITAVAPIMITPRVVTPSYSEPPIKSVPPYTLIITWDDNGRSFTIPVGTQISANFAQMPYSRLAYDPTILQPTWIEPYPYPYPYPQPYPPHPQPDMPPDYGYPYANWRLVAVRAGTTDLTLVNEPCPMDRVCPKMPIREFSVTINIYGSYPPPPPIPPHPAPPSPPILPGADVYIGTAYLEQTVRVQSGQTIAIDLPFLASQESVSLNYDSTILSPLPGQTLDYPQSGGWRFRVIKSGSTVFTVNSTRCLYAANNGTDCPPSLLFRVTIASGGQ